jgi:hypothetical protein
MSRKQVIASVLNYGLLPGSGNILLGKGISGTCQTLVSLALLGSLALFTIRGFQMVFELASGEYPTGYNRNLGFMILTMMLLGLHLIWVSKTFSSALKEHNTPPPLSP